MEAEDIDPDSIESLFRPTEEDKLSWSDETEDSIDYAPYPLRHSKQMPEEQLSPEVGEEMRKRHWSEVSDDAREGAIS